MRLFAEDDPRNKHALTWIAACLSDDARRLSAWEQGFVESLNERVGDNPNFSSKTLDVLERIYTEKA